MKAHPIGLAVSLGIAYFLTACLSLDLMTPPGLAVFWPPAGISSGVLITLGRTARWPVAVGVFAATFAASLTGDRSVLESTILALNDAGEALLVAWIIKRHVSPDFSLGRLRHVLGLLAATIVATTVSGLGGTVVGYKLSHSPGESAWVIWQQWVASGAIGIISVAPLIIGVAGALRAPPSRRELAEGGVALVAVAAATSIFIFMLPPAWWETSVLVVLLFPLVLWIAARYQAVFASAAVFIVSLVVITTVTFRLGHFSDLIASIDDHILSAQVTIVGTALCAFVLSALFAERRQQEAAAVEAEKHLQEALTAGAVMAYDWDVSTNVVRRSRSAAQVLGFDPQQSLDSAPFLGRVHPDDFASMQTLRSTLSRDNPTYSIVFRFLRLDGREVWLHETSKAEFDAAGRLMRLKGSARDITDRKRLEEHQNLLMAELDHRVKNVLARVAMLATTTRKDSASVDQYVESLLGRIQSMAVAHRLLSESRWQNVGLGALVEKQLAPYARGSNLTIEGEDIVLGPAKIQAVAMVLHELVTNAVKYGALSVPDGRVCITWSRVNLDADAKLLFRWCELGGPPVGSNAPSGYGTSLIRNLIPHEFGGRVDLIFTPDGVNCEIEMVLE